MHRTNSHKIRAAYRYCQEMANRHYENFPVASKLIPPHLRPHIAAVYAFARTADDFADEEKNEQKLLDWQNQLHHCLNQTPEHPVFIALSQTIRTFQLPLQWFNDLITAFLWDLHHNRFNTLKELREYCRFSANPVGRIVLWIFGYRNSTLMEYADYITTALQLTNFWQDISVDVKKDRVYIPLDLLSKHGVEIKQIIAKQSSPGFETVIRELSEKTQSLFDKGKPLFYSIRGRLRWELYFTVRGGMEILNKVARLGSKILQTRPVLSKRDWMKIIFKSSLTSV